MFAEGMGGGGGGGSGIRRYLKGNGAAVAQNATRSAFFH